MEIDEVRTADKVNNFFIKTVPHLLFQTGRSRLDLKSPSMDSSGVTVHGGNYVEDTQIFNINAACAVKAIVDSISVLSDSERKPYRRVVVLRYGQDLLDEQIYTRLGYSRSHYYRIKRKALCEFAERIAFFKLQNHAEISELRVFIGRN